MFSFALVVIVLLPGMSEPKVDKLPMESMEKCLEVAKASGESVMGKFANEQFTIAFACEIAGTKSDPT